MLRDKSLIPLSRQHQHALALCVRIERASPIAQNDLPQWRTEVRQHFDQEISIHFAAEEQLVFPAAREFGELTPLVEELIAEHELLRNSFSKVSTLSASELSAMAQKLSSHIRKEERQLFESMQKVMGTDALAALGARLEQALKDAGQVCALPVGGNAPQEKRLK